jgi:hypothetical protein
MAPNEKSKAKSKKKKVRTFRAALKAAAGAHRDGLGFQSIGFDGERRLVNKTWMKKGDRSDLASRYPPD